ncbi:peptidylprolyl isomerase [uncultured Sphingomonas sp.]|uniref:peptidylprolyl isomerase n=1 Tax=uncultured Sphingomonas sp. TaxID=158754 RepID=UPI0035CB85FF
MRAAFALAALALLAAAPAPPAGVVRVRIVTSDGPIVIAVDGAHAPRTAANFLLYVDDGRFDGTTFYRAAKSRGPTSGGFIEGGIGTDPRRTLPPVPLERTSRTRLRHVAGAVTMARFDQPDSATGNFSILVGPSPSMDAHGKRLGYAVFGRVVTGMDVVKRILAEPAGGGSGAMKGQLLARPVRILRAQRLDGQPHPSGRPKPWTLGL